MSQCDKCRHRKGCVEPFYKNGCHLYEPETIFKPAPTRQDGREAKE